jgi:hypothetical protein
MTQTALQELEKQLAAVTLERDELQRDVETMCLQGTGTSIFDSSSFLSERIYAAGVSKGHEVRQPGGFHSKL